MGLNPARDDEEQNEYRDLNAIGVEGATVIERPSVTNGEQPHAVRVVPDTLDESIVADVAVPATGDAFLPEPNSRVTIAYRPSEEPIVLNERYQDGDSPPTVSPGERVIGHPASESILRLKPDGGIVIIGETEVTVTNTTDAVVQIEDDGTISVAGDTDVVINDGDTRAVTDVSPSGRNNEGGITGIEITRSPNVYLPE